MDQVLSVAQLVNLLNSVLSDIGILRVEGEVSSLKFSKNNAVFLDLKDAKENALLKLSNYAPKVEGLKEITEGMKVIVDGYFEMYAPYGQLNFKPTRIQPQGEGALKSAFEQLKSKLEEEGLFAVERKRPLPKFITHIALITGKESAAYTDFTKILAENLAGFQVDFYPVLVQGENSAYEVAAALEKIGRTDAEVVALVRGGGSLEDLKSFNSEIVAKAIFNSRIPVVVGVGHEVDMTISCYVSDLRASTPSQAAYYLVQQNSSFLDTLHTNMVLNAEIIQRSIQDQKTFINKFTNLDWILRKSIPSSNEIEQRERLFISNFNGIRLEIEKWNSYINNFSSNHNALARKINNTSALISGISGVLTAYDPTHTLDRGYSLIKYKDQYISTTDKLKIGEKITIKMKKGEILSKIENITNN